MKTKNFIYILSILSVVLNFKTSYSQEILEKDSEIVKISGTKKREFIKFYSGYIIINESFYQDVKKNIENFKSSNYFVDLLSLEYGDIKKVKSCQLINFNANYITNIKLIKGKDELKKDENRRIISMIVKYDNSQIKYKNNISKIETIINLETETGDEGECGAKIVINNCNDGNNGINCLKQLPQECFIMLPQNNQATCVNLKNDKSALISYACSRDGCFLLDIMVR